MGVDFDMAGIDHEPLEIRLVHEFGQQALPMPFVPPAAKAPVGVAPATIIGGKIPPGSAGAQNPQDGVDESTVVMGHSSPRASPSGKQGLQSGPEAVGNVVAAMIFGHADIQHQPKISVK